MNMKHIRGRAAKLGIKPGNMKKTDLIRAIQIEEGNSPCFLAMKDSCSQTDCCWKRDCLPASSN
ncbi:MAG: SAP domain-containing protein [Candidatus Electrothrix sp. AR5]|nr:SAP domain-containing protein [Candidatus Electrothrix sp. AR5]